MLRVSLKKNDKWNPLVSIRTAKSDFLPLTTDNTLDLKIWIDPEFPMRIQSTVKSRRKKKPKCGNFQTYQPV